MNKKDFYVKNLENIVQFGYNTNLLIFDNYDEGPHSKDFYSGRMDIVCRETGDIKYSEQFYLEAAENPFDVIDYEDMSNRVTDALATEVCPFHFIKDYTRKVIKDNDGV